MKSIRCTKCHFLGWEADESCKRCGARLHEPDISAAGFYGDSGVGKDVWLAEVGLLPRLASALWFALAACGPVTFFFMLMGMIFKHGSSPNDFATLWLLIGLPVSSAALCGFTSGAKILDPWITGTAFQAARRGLMVALNSYIIFIAMFVCVGSLASGDAWTINLLYGAIALFFYGAIFVGWIIALAGAISGWTLFYLSRRDALDDWLIGAQRVSRRTLKKWVAMAVLIFFASSIPCALTLRAVARGKEKERTEMELIRAASDGDAVRLKSLLEAGADANLKGAGGWPPIIWAARERHTQAVEVLLEHGANPNVREDGNMSPLMSAANDGDLRMVEALLAHGADANLATGGGYTPLMYAAMAGNVEVASALLEKGADVNAQAADGNTALALAQSKRDTISKHDLLAQGPNARGQYDYGDPALLERSRRKHDQLASLLKSMGAYK